MSRTVPIRVEPDHIGKLTTATAITALAELVWNALDADAHNVQIKLVRNGLDAIQEIHVIDDGTGIPPEEVDELFGAIGGSWKARSGKSLREGRILHGRDGKGRFKALSLGTQVEWRTTTHTSEAAVEYRIVMNRSNLANCEIGESEALPLTGSRSGTTVIVSGIVDPLPILVESEARQDLTEHLALYLSQYPKVIVEFDHIQLRPDELCARKTIRTIKVDPDGNDRPIMGTLTIIEWNIPSRRQLYYCDMEGFAFHQVAPGIHAPGFSFTAYIQSDLLSEQRESSGYLLGDLQPDVVRLMNAVKAELKQYFADRSQQALEDRVSQWKQDNIYPYPAAAGDILDTARRQVFDVVAIHVSEHLPKFNDQSIQSRRFTFQLMKEALESEPRALHRILREVIDLPADKQKELSQLLERTSLEALMRAGRVVADRLDFIQAVEDLLFSRPFRKDLLERRQLQELIIEHTWLFGEEYNLSASEITLTNALRAHRKKLGGDYLIDDESADPVLLSDGKEGRLDLLFSRTIPQSHTDDREYLVVELKRPSVRVGPEELTQIKKYAYAVASDDRFDKAHTKWVFIVMCNSMDDFAKQESHQRGKPPGLLHDSENGKLQVWIREWADVIRQARGRLRFFEQQMGYSATAESARDYLMRTHKRLLPLSYQAQELPTIPE